MPSMAPPRLPQPDRDGDGLVVVKEQRRDGGTHAEPVAAPDPGTASTA